MRDVCVYSLGNQEFRLDAQEIRGPSGVGVRNGARVLIFFIPPTSEVMQQSQNNNFGSHFSGLVPVVINQRV